MFALPVLLVSGAFGFARAGLRGLSGGLFLQQPAGVVLGLLALGEIARDFQETAHAPTFVVQRRDNDVGPEARAIFAHAPVVVLEAAGRGRGFELVVRPVLGERFRRVKAREMPADDFLGPVTLEAFGAGVPARHV